MVKWIVERPSWFASKLKPRLSSCSKFQVIKKVPESSKHHSLSRFSEKKSLIRDQRTKWGVRDYIYSSHIVRGISKWLGLRKKNTELQSKGPARCYLISTNFRHWKMYCIILHSDYKRDQRNTYLLTFIIW